MTSEYRCDSCHGYFDATRKRCPACGREGTVTNRDTCWDCGATLVDSANQQCPTCGTYTSG